MTRWFRALVTALAVAVALPPPASARSATVRDGNDTKGPLDVRRVYHLGGRRPMWKISTGSNWTARRVFERGFVLVYLDTFGPRDSDYYALLWSNRARMRGTLVRDRSRPRRDRAIAGLKVWRRDRGSVSVRIPLARLFVSERRTSYRWYVKTIVGLRRCARAVCIDRAPDARSVEEPLPDPNA